MEMVILFLLATFLTLRYGVTDMVATAKGTESPRERARRRRGIPPRQRRTGRGSARRFFGELWDDAWDDANQRRHRHHQRAKSGDLPRQRAGRAVARHARRAGHSVTDAAGRRAAERRAWRTNRQIDEQARLDGDSQPTGPWPPPPDPAAEDPPGPHRVAPGPRRLRPVDAPLDYADLDEDTLAWGVVTADADGALQVTEHTDHDTAQRAAEGNPWLPLGGTLEAYPLAYHHPQQGWLLAATGRAVPDRTEPTGPWHRVRVHWPDGHTHHDAIRGHDQADAEHNARWNWITANPHGTATGIDYLGPDGSETGSGGGPAGEQWRVVDDQGPNGHTRYRPMDRAQAEDLAGQVRAERDRTYPNPDIAPGGVHTELHTTGSGGTTMTAPTATTEVTGVYSLRHFYLGVRRDLGDTQDTLNAAVQRAQRMATVADQAIGQLSTDRFGPGTIAGASNVLDAVSAAAARLSDAQAAVDAAVGAVHQATQQIHVHRGLEEATAGAGAEAPADVRRTHGQD